MRQFNVIALTHRQLGLELVGKFHIQPEEQVSHFEKQLSQFDIREFMFLSTCNRVEFFFRTGMSVDETFVRNWLTSNYSNLSEAELEKSITEARTYNGLEAVRHVFHVASSLDSMIVGEREIITQVRQAHQRFRDAKLSKDFIRIAVNKAIETAKAVYTDTDISTRPISVVNLGFKKLLDKGLNSSQNIVLIGAGTTIEAIAGNLKAYNINQVKVFNRTESKAKRVAKALGGEGYALSELTNQVSDFDVLITCTGAPSSVVDLQIFKTITSKSNANRVILDLAIPADIDAAVLSECDVDYVAIEDLKQEAKQNLKAREKEIFRCEKLVEERLIDFEESFRTRRLEMAMGQIPKLMKEIKSNALDHKFARDLENMDPEQREKLEEIMNYLEKKYISLPMRMAKQLVLDKDLKDSVIE